MNLNRVISGSGPDVVLIHGWGAAAGVWHELADVLAARFRVHALDLPGHGATPARAWGGLEDWVELVARNMPHPCHVVGWSLGALIALAWAQAAPQQVGRMALLAATPCFARRDDWVHGVDVQVLKAFERELMHDTSRALRRFIALQVLGDADAGRVGLELRRHVPQDARPDHDALDAGLRMLLETDLRQVLMAIPQPTLVVHGDRDRLIPPAAGEYVGARIPSARFELVQGAAHAPFLSRPGGVSDLLMAFLHG